MVKVRGYRVELGEVERTLLAHPAIREVAVISWERDARETCLVAYLVSRLGNLPVDQLISFLRMELPDYMIPAVFMFVDSLPSTNGKLDRKALPKPESKRPRLSSAYEPPRTDIEWALAAIWGEVLSIDMVGIRDNFFDLGGNSLSATRVLARITAKYPLEIPLSTIFEYPTIAEIALVIDAAMGAESAQQAIPREIESLSEERQQIVQTRRNESNEN
jgi:hypothetical protein